MRKIWKPTGSRTKFSDLQRQQSNGKNKQTVKPAANAKANSKAATDDQETLPEDDEVVEEAAESGNYMVLGMCFGLCLGAALGQSLFENIAVGISLGMCLGLAIGSAIKRH